MTIDYNVYKIKKYFWFIVPVLPKITNEVKIIKQENFEHKVMVIHY